MPRMHIDGLTYISVRTQTTTAVEERTPLPAEWSTGVFVSDDASPLLTINGYTLTTCTGQDLATVVDEISGNTAAFAQLFDGDGIVPEVEDELSSGLGDRVVIVDKVWLDPQWRGRGGVGLYLAGIALRTHFAGAVCMLLKPAPYELKRRGEEPDPELWAAGVERLTRLWGELGFEPSPIDPGLLVLDPGLTKLDDAVKTLASRIGVSS